MATRSHIGYRAETTYGTALVVTRFIPLVSESLKTEIEQMESEGIIAGRRILDSNQWTGGNISISGDIQHELYPRGLGPILRSAFGNVSSAGSNPTTHTFTVGDLTSSSRSLTIQVGIQDVGGTVRPFTYTGCKIASWEIACSAGEIATMGITIVGQAESTVIAAATVLYSDSTPFTFVNGAVTIGGTAVPVKQVTLSGDNGLADDRRFLGSRAISEPLENDLRTFDGSFELEFTDLTQYARYIAGSEHAMVLAFTAGTQSLTITTNVRFDGETPAVGGREIVPMNLPFKVIAPSTDAAAITAVYVTGDLLPV